MEDELRLAGYLVADGIAATDEDIAGSEHFFHFHSLACAGSVAHLLLDGDIGRDCLFLVHDFLVLPILDEVVNSFNGFLLGIWGDDGYKPVWLVIMGLHCIVAFGVKTCLRRRQVFSTCRGKSRQPNISYPCR